MESIDSSIALSRNAGVHHRHPGGGQVAGGPEARSVQVAEHDLGIHLVLGATERHEGDRGRTFLTGRTGPKEDPFAEADEAAPGPVLFRGYVHAGWFRK